MTFGPTRETTALEPRTIAELVKDHQKRNKSKTKKPRTTGLCSDDDGQQQGGAVTETGSGRPNHVVLVHTGGFNVSQGIIENHDGVPGV